MYKLETSYHNEPIDYIVSNQLNNILLTYAGKADLLSEYYLMLQVNNLVITYGYETVASNYKLVFGLKLELVKAS
jgi:hypothetical protein